MGASGGTDDPGTSLREKLTAVAVELLEEQGPANMTARRVTTRANTSTMAVYTHFGSMGGLVSSVVDHGFDRLAEAFDAVPLGDDVLRNLWLSVEATRQFAFGRRHLYSVMFAAETIGTHERTGDDLRRGTQTLRFLHGRCRDAISAGHFQVPRTMDATRQVWATMHGHIMLELAGYTSADHKDTYPHVMARTFVGLGAAPDAAAAAVAATAPASS